MCISNKETTQNRGLQPGLRLMEVEVSKSLTHMTPSHNSQLLRYYRFVQRTKVLSPRKKKARGFHEDSTAVTEMILDRLPPLMHLGAYEYVSVN